MNNAKYQPDQQTKKCNFRKIYQISTDLSTPVKLSAILLYLAGMIWVLNNQERISSFAEHTELLSPIIRSIMLHAVPVYLLSGGVVLAVLLVLPFDRLMVKEQLQNIGLVNRAGLIPVLIRKKRDKKNPSVMIWEFKNRSIPLIDWENRREAVETALNISILNMSYTKGKRHILIYAVSARTSLPEILHWKNSFLSKENFVLVLGESLHGPVMVNLAHIPHILLGGSTGSGKSLLLKLLLMQSLHKGAEVYIADFKGGVDFPGIWKKKCHMILDEQDLLYTLRQITAVLEYRKNRLAETGCSDIDRYNIVSGENLPRLVFACDEVAEILDKTGRNREDKERLGQIEGCLSTIARQGRAFGIHLILSTQRPDASIIPGQIRNNMDFRVCGRAESVLSQIILDNTSAAEQIPKNARGRFITGEGIVFQGYLFDEKCL